jgi:putative transposase
VVRLAWENARWGYAKIRGELLKLRHRVGETTIAAILRRHGIKPAPQRTGSIGWRHLMRHYKEHILACDLFTVDTLFLQTLYVFFFIELGSRQVHFAGCTRHPDARWMSQHARQMVWQLEERELAIQFLIHDNDRTFAPAFDAVFQAAGVHVIHTPYRAPNANAYAERWVRTVREECLDRLFILSEGHLHCVLQEYVDYYNYARPHQGLQQQAPIPFPQASAQGTIHCRNVLGGILHDYHREAA